MGWVRPRSVVFVHSHKRWWKQGHLSVLLPWWCCCGSLPPLWSSVRAAAQVREEVSWMLLETAHVVGLVFLSNMDFNGNIDVVTAVASQTAEHEQTERKRRAEADKNKEKTSCFYSSPRQPPWQLPDALDKFCFFRTSIWSVQLSHHSQAWAVRGSVETGPNRTHKWNHTKEEQLHKSEAQSQQIKSPEEPCGAERLLVQTVLYGGVAGSSGLFLTKKCLSEAWAVMSSTAYTHTHTRTAVSK